MVFNCGFDLCFPMINDFEAHFMFQDSFEDLMKIIDFLPRKVNVFSPYTFT